MPRAFIDHVPPRITTPGEKLATVRAFRNFPSVCCQGFLEAAWAGDIRHGATRQGNLNCGTLG